MLANHLHDLLLLLWLLLLVLLLLLLELSETMLPSNLTLDKLTGSTAPVSWGWDHGGWSEKRLGTVGRGRGKAFGMGLMVVKLLLLAGVRGGFGGRLDLALGGLGRGFDPGTR